MGAWAMNVVSSVGIIMANKQLMSANGYSLTFKMDRDFLAVEFSTTLFPYSASSATTLTGFHFAVMGTCWDGVKCHGVFFHQACTVVGTVWFSVVANMSITGMNLSLMLNSVGFYQISKLSMIPVVCLMEWVLHNKKLLEGVLSTSLQQTTILVNLLLDHNYSSGAIFFILLSCSLSSSVSQYLCIGRFSAVSFQLGGGGRETVPKLSPTPRVHASKNSLTEGAEIIEGGNGRPTSKSVSPRPTEVSI
ncbi:hypothetical protein HAX54_035810 [Datura stramonium]|uniref:Uncharacterized protein n=1 Tax=Datura stramonium TaxID=4076 RepID=A0ABS8RQJ5_DATST|nr:hypothetical protein [Datura stramonium]